MISIIIPAYNSAFTIAEALESVAAQTPHVDYEVIVVDDCSKDNTVDVVRNWIADHTRHSALVTHHSPLFTLHSLPSNTGPAGARNRGIQEAQGEWIAFLDADDIWLPNHLEVLMAAARETRAIMVCGESVRFQTPADTRSVGEGWKENNSLQSNSTLAQCRVVTLEELAWHNPVATSTVIVQKVALDEVNGFDPQFRGPEDYDLWIRIAALTRDTLSSGIANITHVAVPVSLYRQACGSLSMDDRKFLPQILRVLEKAYAHGGILAGLPQWKNSALALQYQQASWMAFNRGCRGAAIRYLMASFVFNLKGPKRHHYSWVKFLYRYTVGRREGI